VKCVNIVMYRIIIMLVEGKFLIMMRSCTNSMLTYHKLIINSVLKVKHFYLVSLVLIAIAIAMSS
jgi:hypothetical protein